MQDSFMISLLFCVLFRLFGVSRGLFLLVSSSPCLPLFLCASVSLAQRVVQFLY